MTSEFHCDINLRSQAERATVHDSERFCMRLTDGMACARSTVRIGLNDTPLGALIDEIYGLL